jgi:hypothetical protein
MGLLELQLAAFPQQNRLNCAVFFAETRWKTGQ